MPATETRTTAAPANPSAMTVADPALASDGLDNEGMEAHHDFAWMTVFVDRSEMRGELDGARCLEHGPRRPFLGFRVSNVCAA